MKFRFAPWQSVRGRLLLLAILVEALMLTLLVANSLRLLEGYMAEQAKRHAEQFVPVLNAALVAPLAQSDYATVQAILDESHATRLIDYLAVVGNNGKIVAVSGWEPNQPLPAPDRTFTLFGKYPPRYDVATPVSMAGQTLGTLYFGLDLTLIVAAHRQLLIQGAGIAIGELVLSIALLTLLGFWLTRHLAALTRASEAVAGGNFTPPPVEEGNDEIGKLGAAFNAMSRNVAEHIRELTEARDLQQALAASVEQGHSQLLALLSAMEFGVLFIDLEGRVVYVNPGFLALWGMPAQTDLTGKPVSSAWGGRTTGKADSHGFLESLLREDTAEICLPNRRIITHRAYPVRNRDGWEIGRLIVNVDVTERRRAENDLKHLNDTLEQRVQEEIAQNREKDHMLIQQARLAAMGEMIGNIAHQWRQPLNALGILLANIKDAYEYQELDKEYLDGSHEKGKQLIQRMSTTIDDFRNFFKPNTEKKRFRMCDCAAGAVGMVVDSFKNQGVEVINESCCAPCFVDGYPNEFSQVVLNALSNAKDAVVKNGPPGKIWIKLDLRGDYSTLSVRDNGGGIPEEILPKVFDPYFTTKEKGTGIGLYMSKMIMEKMGGDITVHNIEGGAEVLLTLPLATNTDA